MWLGGTLWLLLSYFQFIKCNILEDYEEISRSMLYPPEDKVAGALPVEIGKDQTSGCMCRSSRNRKIIVCFGNYECQRFPKVRKRCEVLVVRTTNLPEIRVSELDSLYYLKTLKIEANHQLKYLQPGLFRNLTTLESLSISYSTKLHIILEGTFDGLKGLRNLNLVGNGFTNILQITAAFEPSKLPSLQSLDLSENALEKIPENAFKPMRGSPLKRLDITLCRIDFIHPDSFLHLEFLQELSIGENDMNSTIIGDFLLSLKKNNRNLTRLDLNSMGFRKYPPRRLMEIIANTTLERLTLSNNQFEIITDDTFPKMPHLKVLELQSVSAMSIGPNAFDPIKFPDLRILLISGNNLPGLHWKNMSNQQLVLLDMSYNKGTASNPMYYEIDRGAFLMCKELKVLNLAFNRLKSIFDYTFLGLEKLKMLNLENGTIYHIGRGSFKPMKNLEILNLANNPLTANDNLTSGQFEGLNELKILILKNCGIKYFLDEDNIFVMMSNLTHLILSNNELFYISTELLKPLKSLQVLDLSENLIVSWWKPIFLLSGLRLHSLYLTDNKISHLTISMIQDMDYLLENKGNFTVEIDLMNNVFICDCSSMFKSYTWLQTNGSNSLKNFIRRSKFLCSSPQVWEDKSVAEFLSSIKALRCLMFERISNLTILIWTTPSVVTVVILILIIILIYKYKIYITYWLFLAKLALGRKFIKKSLKVNGVQKICHKYDAFVSYCNEDREFVLEMVNQLERSPPHLKLCIYERDFEIGSFISEAILGSINESRYVILLISNDFAKSTWCRWETQLAEYHRLFLEDGTSYDPLVLIRIGNVESKYLTTTLKFLLKTKIYLSWDDKRPDDFWNKLRNLIAKHD